jgi:Ca2+/Na+ antiporter
MEMPSMSVILQSIVALVLLIIGMINIIAVTTTTGPAEDRNTSGKNAVNTSRILFVLILVMFLLQAFTLYGEVMPKSA